MKTKQIPVAINNKPIHTIHCNSKQNASGADVSKHHQLNIEINYKTGMHNTHSNTRQNARCADKS